MRILELYRITRIVSPRAANPSKGLAALFYYPTNQLTKLTEKEISQARARQEKMEVRTMTVLFSELLVPGWAEGPDAMIGIKEVSDAAFNLPCHTTDPEVFFAESKAEISYAKALCGECPLKAKCLEGALSRQEPLGVWGGELFDNGRVISEKRAPGRPRLNARVDEVLAS